MVDQPRVALPALGGGQAASWAALIELAPMLGDHWLLIGGQMVLLHEVERHASAVRPTHDVDVAVNLRAVPSGLAAMHDALTSTGFRQDTPSPTGTAHRYRRGKAVIDVLAPDRIGSRARLTLGAGRTLEAPGSTQAFRRSELVTVTFEGAEATIRRPNLIGALLGKAAAVTKIPSQTMAERTKHLHDADALAQLLGVRDRRSADLTRTESRMLEALANEADLSPLASAQISLLLAPDRP
jgi:hypothetical protein